MGAAARRRLVLTVMKYMAYGRSRLRWASPGPPPGCSTPQWRILRGPAADEPGVTFGCRVYVSRNSQGTRYLPNHTMWAINNVCHLLDQ